MSGRSAGTVVQHDRHVQYEETVIRFLTRCRWEKADRLSWVTQSNKSIPCIGRCMYTNIFEFIG